MTIVGTCFSLLDNSSWSMHPQHLLIVTRTGYYKSVGSMSLEWELINTMAISKKSISTYLVEWTSHWLVHSAKYKAASKIIRLGKAEH